jgi:hypothetical protein
MALPKPLTRQVIIGIVPLAGIGRQVAVILRKSKMRNTENKDGYKNVL